MDAAPETAAGQLPEEALDRVRPEAGGRREVEGPAPAVRQPVRDGRVLVGEVVVHDGMDLRSGGSMYNPMTSQVFSVKSGSVDTLNCRTLCGASRWRTRILCTVVGGRPSSPKRAPSRASPRPAPATPKNRSSPQVSLACLKWDMIGCLLTQNDDPRPARVLPLAVAAVRDRLDPPAPLVRSLEVHSRPHRPASPLPRAVAAPFLRGPYRTLVK